MEVVFFYDLLWDNSVVHVDVLEIRHECAKLEVIDIKSTVAGSVFGVLD